MKIIILTLALLMPTVALAEPQRQTFKDANGRELGRSTTDARGNTTFREAIHHGERRRHEVLRFATRHCKADADLRLAAAVQADLRRLRRYDEQHLVDRTLAVLLAHWPAVEAVATALVENGRIEGEDVEAIIARSMIRSAS